MDFAVLAIGEPLPWVPDIGIIVYWWNPFVGATYVNAEQLSSRGNPVIGHGVVQVLGLTHSVSEISSEGGVAVAHVVEHSHGSILVDCHQSHKTDQEEKSQSHHGEKAIKLLLHCHGR